jgi:ATP-dependent RNA helicase DHX8/PRP22
MQERNWDDDEKTRRSTKRMSSPERWELTQLVNSGVLPTSERPDLDETHG